MNAFPARSSNSRGPHPRPPDPRMTGSDEAARVRQAANAGTCPTILHRLALDPAVTVRAAVAMNPSYAPDAHHRLATDEDDRVRALLGAKIARLLPGLTAKEHIDAQAHVHAILLGLASDAADRVRITIADVLTDMPHAPRAVILKLANDPVQAVSDPILRLSPLLTEPDLLELLATPAHAGTATAVAARIGLGAAAADHIAAHADAGAVRTLLQNQSAAIREATLDALVGRASDHPEWHEPLVTRPALHPGAARALARLLAGSLLDRLRGRQDISPDLVDELRHRMDDTLDPTPPASDPEPDEAALLASVQHMHETGQLTEAALLEAAASGNHREVAAILAVASGVTLQALDRAISTRSAKGLISLVWKAGFSMRAAQQVQASLGQLAPAETLGTGAEAYPLSGDEMEWQIELLAEPGR